MADGQAAHNVYFDPSQNPAGAQLPPASPYLTQAGQTWEMTADMGAGSYDYICQPHAATGMTGQITVE
jgi:plastocyanin